jgi:hypothetical protein
MKFFTRERYDAVQRDSRRAEREWDQASHDYSKHVEQIRAQLPTSAHGLLELTLHDGTVGSVEHPAPGILRIVVDASGNPWGPRGIFALTFAGLNEATFREPAIGDWWLYEEIHLSDAGLGLHVLLRRSEMIVDAAAVTIDVLTGAV